LKASSFRQFCLYWLPPLAITIVILIFSGDLGSTANTQKWLRWLLSWLPFLGEYQFQEGQGYLRKAGHILAYGSLYFLWFRAWLWRLSPRRGAATLWSLAFCLLIALADEGQQSFFSSRCGCLSDVALDFGAAAVAALAFSLKRI
jgi:VanZ family protein